MLRDEAVQRLQAASVWKAAFRLGVMDDYGALHPAASPQELLEPVSGIELRMETGLTSGMVGRLGHAYDIVIAVHEAGEQTGEFLRREQAV